MYLKDPKSGEPSFTLTMCFVTLLVCCFKLLVAGITIGSITMSAFSGADFGMAVGAAGAIYGWRKATDSKSESENKE